MRALMQTLTRALMRALAVKVSPNVRPNFGFTLGLHWAYRFLFICHVFWWNMGLRRKRTKQNGSIMGLQAPDTLACH